MIEARVKNWHHNAAELQSECKKVLIAPLPCEETWKSLIVLFRHGYLKQDCLHKTC